MAVTSGKTIITCEMNSGKQRDLTINQLPHKGDGEPYDSEIFETVFDSIAAAYRTDEGDSIKSIDRVVVVKTIRDTLYGE